MFCVWSFFYAQKIFVKNTILQSTWQSSWESCRSEIFYPTLLRSDSTTDAFPEILEVLRTLTRIVCDETSFQNSHGWKTMLLKTNSTKDVDLGIFRNFQKSRFWKQLLKNIWSNLLVASRFQIAILLL